MKLLVSHCWTLMKQEANERDKPHLWSVMSELCQEIQDVQQFQDWKV